MVSTHRDNLISGRGDCVRNSAPSSNLCVWGERRRRVQGRTEEEEEEEGRENEKRARKGRGGEEGEGGGGEEKE